MANNEPGERLRAAGITVQFGGVTALSNIDVNVPPAEIVGLVGPNGAGKTTLLAVLSGLIRPTAGHVYMSGAEVTNLTAQARARRGLGRTFQQPELFAGLTVREHLTLADRARNAPARLVTDIYTGHGLRQPDAAEVDRVAGLINLLGIGEFADRDVLSLPLGLARLVEVARALATRPEVLLLDEPSSGLDHHETQRLTDALEAVRTERGTSMVLVAHDVEMVLGLASFVYVLDFGACIAAAPSSDIRANHAVQTAYLGERAPTEQGVHPHSEDGHQMITPLLLEADSVSVHYGPARALAAVSLRVYEGSAVAVLGANGAGKSTLARAITGLIPTSSGRITFAGRDITGWPAHRIRRLGLVCLPEGRGIFPGLSVSDNLRMAVATLPRKERPDAVEQAIEAFPFLAKRSRQLAASLSGGEQQMLSLARIVAIKPRLVVADELSLGLAPRIVDEVYQALEKALKGGMAIVLIEQFVKRALELAGSCTILQRGEVRWAGRSIDLGNDILDHYLGSKA